MFQRLMAVALPVATIARWWIAEAASRHFPPPGGGGYQGRGYPGGGDANAIVQLPCSQHLSCPTNTVLSERH
jgi:hypothetical protein